MVKRLLVLAALFLALCFAGEGCFRGGAYIGLGDGIYYDGPYRNGSDLLHYYDGGFYHYQGGDYRFDHYVPQDGRKYYEERYRNITNSIIAIILSPGTDIRDTPGNPQERKNGRNKT